MTESAEPSGRFDFSAEDDPRIPSEDEEEKKKKKKYSGKKGMSTGGFTKMLRFRGKRSYYEEVEDLSELQGIGIRRYEYMELHTATQGFSYACKIGADASYVAYRGMLREPEGERAVAIKLLSKTFYDDVQFHIAEVKALSEVRHQNVIKLLGRCHEADHLAVVFEFMPNLSLDRHLHGYNDRPPLPWKVRYSTIAVGIASALLYLQEGLERCVIHRDIKPSNIWLDSNFKPKLAAFELSIVGECDGLELDGVFGTPGYLDPHYLLHNKISKATDIYSFGVVALQIASGRKAFVSTEEERLFLSDWVEKLHKKGKILEAVDPKLGDDFDEREVERLLLIGLWCTKSYPELRPSAKLILQLLNFEAPKPSKFISNVKGNVDTISTETDGEDDWLPRFSKQDGEYELLSENLIDEGAFKTDGDDDRLPILVQDVGEHKLLSEQTAYNIGIPPDFGSAEITNHRKDYNRHIFEGFLRSLLEMMHSKENVLRFDEALEKIKMYTTCLIQAIGPPLDDWNTLAQLVLQSLKEREDLSKSCDDRESLADDFSVSSLDEERTLKEDEEKLEDVKERLARARQRCSILVAKLAEAQEISLSTEAEVKAMEQTIAEKRALLVRRERHRAFLEHYESTLSKLSSFTG